MRNFPYCFETKKDKYERKHLVCFKTYADFEGMNGFPICMNAEQEMSEKIFQQKSVANSYYINSDLPHALPSGNHHVIGPDSVK